MNMSPTHPMFPCRGRRLVFCWEILITDHRSVEWTSASALPGLTPRLAGSGGYTRRCQSGISLVATRVLVVNV